MKTINQNLYFLNLSTSSKKQNLVLKPFLILILFFISICPKLFSQDFSNQLNYDSVVAKPDYRNHLNIPEYNPGLMPLDRQTNITGVWTELNPKVPRVDYLGIHFVNKDTGWTVGAQGVILRSIDGGESWQNILSPITSVLTNVHSFNGQIVVAVGYDGKIIRSTDSGINWQQVTSGVTGDLWRVQMINDTLGWGCGSNNFILKTTDGGVTWIPTYTSYNTMIFKSLSFFNENFGCIVGGDIDGGHLLKTTNGGQDWQDYSFGGYTLVSVKVLDTLRIFAGGFARIVTTLNGGNTWNTTGVDGGVNTIEFADSLIGYAGLQQSSVWKTTNGGASWEIAAGIMPTFAKYWIMFPYDTVGFTVGSALNIRKTTNKGLQWIPTVFNDDFNDVEFINETTGFILSTKLYKTENSGLIWNIVNGAPRGGDLLFIDSTTGFIGNDTTLYKTTDGGNNWYVVNGISSGVSKIFFINSQFGWAIGGRNIYKTIDGGENWVVQFTHITDSFTSIFFVDSLNGWATSRYIHQSTDGGISWIQRTDIQLYFTRDIYFTETDTGFVTEGLTGNDLYKTVNGGLNWQRDTRIETALYFNYFPNKYHWILNGGAGQIWETTDNGNFWTEISEYVSSGFGRFQAPKEWIGYAVGGIGLILKYEDSSYVPVELISFEGSIENNKIKLSWQTASELNNKGFYIEKSFDEESWFKIGFIEGKGTTAELNSYSFVDDEGNQLVTQFYRLKQIDFNGTYEYSIIIEVNSNLSITSFRLYQNYPNPFNSSTIITYQIPQKSLVNISLYDIKGERVIELLNKEKESGLYKTAIENTTLPSGIYFIRMITSDGFSAVKKITLIK